MKNDKRVKYMERPVNATIYLILFAAMPGISDSERMMKFSLRSQQGKNLSIGPNVLSSVISQMEDSIKGKLSCVILMVDTSVYNMGKKIVELDYREKFATDLYIKLAKLSYTKYCYQF